MGVYVKAPFIELLKGYEQTVSERSLKSTVERMSYCFEKIHFRINLTLSRIIAGNWYVFSCTE